MYTIFDGDAQGFASDISYDIFCRMTRKFSCILKIFVL